MAEAPAANGASRTPADFLKAIRGQKVVVKLNSGVDYKGALAWMSCLQNAPRTRGTLSHAMLLSAGTLACLDGFMNIAMEQTEVRDSRNGRA